MSGPSTLRYAIPSGAGRTVTRRDRTAASIRATTTRRVQLGRHPRRRPPGLRHPQPAQQRTHPGIHHPPLPTTSVAVAATTATATRSPHTPADSAAIVCGISCTNARANPTNRSPNVGDSRRANATTDPTDRATSCGATTSREHRNASVARA